MRHTHTLGSLVDVPVMGMYAVEVVGLIGLDVKVMDFNGTVFTVDYRMVAE